MRGFNLFAKGKRSLRRDAPEKQSTKIHYFSGEEFQLVVSLAREIKGAVSIAVAGKTGWFLRIQGSFCFLEQKKQSRQFGNPSLEFSLMFLAAGGYRLQSRTAGKRMPLLGHDCLKLKPLQIDRFKVVACLENRNDQAVSFEFIKRPGWFVRARHRGCFIERRVKDAVYEKDCSFYPLINFWFPDFVVFESVTRAAHYLRMKDGRMILDHYDGTIGFKEEASFKLAKKKRRISTMEETKDDNEVTLNAKETAGSDCCCSDCVSEVSFQIYEESSFICENCDCKNDFAEQDSKNGNIND